MDKLKFSSRLLELRQSKKFTQEELALRLGVTPQAVSKWERGIGLPDIELVCEMSKLFDVSLDSLFNINNKFTESGSNREKDELFNAILAEPVTLRVGQGLVKALIKENEENFKKIQEIRKQMAIEFGYLLPVVRIKDSCLCDENEYQVVIYDRILFSKHIDKVSEFEILQMYSDLKRICIDNYSLIINRQIIKNLIDNIKNHYPAIVDNIIPNKISYATIQNILVKIIKQKKSIHNLIKIIESIEDKIEMGKDVETIGNEMANIL